MGDRAAVQSILDVDGICARAPGERHINGRAKIGGADRAVADDEAVISAAGVNAQICE
jgi:hypothetical protein